MNMNRKYKNGCNSVASQQWSKINKNKFSFRKIRMETKPMEAIEWTNELNTIIIELNFGETTSAHIIHAF